MQQEIEEGNFSVTDERVGPKHYSLWGEDKGFMKRDHCVEIHRKLHEISLQYMKGLRNLPTL